MITNGAGPAPAATGCEAQKVGLAGDDRAYIPASNEQQRPDLTWTNPSEIDRAADRAWEELGGSYSDWARWKTIGESLVHARHACMLDTHSNQPKGRAYNTAFGAWLSKRTFRSIDQGDRSRLFRVMDNLTAIEAWRATLTEAQLRQYNHPSTVWRKWLAAAKPTTIPQPTARIRLKDENAALRAENADLQRRLAAGDGNLWTPTTSARELARLFFDSFSERKWLTIVTEVEKLRAARNVEGADKQIAEAVS